MNCLVIHAHPDPESFSTALRLRAVQALEDAGHRVEVIDLYASGYDPAMSEQEHIDYYSNGLAHPDPVVAEHIEQLQRAEMLVFVYPTWWSGLPAIMKGWLDRTFLPEVAFTLGDADQVATDTNAPDSKAPDSKAPDAKAAVQAGLTNVTRLVGVTTYGSKRSDVAVLGDAGRRTITRTVRLVCAKRCKTTWLGLHQLDTATPEARTEFLDRVAEKLTKAARGSVLSR